MPERSPLAPNNTPSLPPIAGLRLASLNCGIRYSGRKDLLLMECAPGTTVAGVFTRSLTASAPIERCKRHLLGGEARGLLVNSGNSNAFTGQIGEQAVNQTLARAAALIGCEPEELFVASTGVIGEPLPYERILAALPDAHAQLAEDDWQGAAEAIMTTDTFAKLATRTAEMNGVTVTLNGIAKGSGMIAPDMATMLAFIGTDAGIPAPVLQAMLDRITPLTFNAITVDSDTSTSDCVLVFATGQAGTGHASSPSPLEGEGRGGGYPPLARDEQILAKRPPHLASPSRGEGLNKEHGPWPTAYGPFYTALHSLCLDLAQQIVRDGEGASKFVTVDVSGAESDPAARAVAMSIANSPLVKTAVAGQDPNWGRLVMAVGKSGQRADRDRLKIWIGEALVAESGQRAPGYDEAAVAAIMRQPEITFRVDLGLGTGRFTAWTCDFTDQYIRINADYRS